jgi:predicted DNA repair protein MutK
MLGGCLSVFRGAEKVWHVLNPSDHTRAEDLVYKEKLADAHLEEKKVKGAIKTDFILSAEIMTITLSALPPDLGSTSGWWAARWPWRAIIITAAVYGAVALIVKADDVGLHMAAEGRLAATRRMGEAIVKGMPHFLTFLVIVGTAAMIWVGGSIIVHALSEMGIKLPYLLIKGVAQDVAFTFPQSMWGFMQWLVTAGIDGVIGLILGFILIPVVLYVITPLMGMFSKGEKAAEGH